MKYDEMKSHHAKQSKRNAGYIIIRRFSHIVILDKANNQLLIENKYTLYFDWQ